MLSNPTIRTMSSSTSGFSLAEKLAIVQALDSFDSNFIVQARIVPKNQGLSILKEMTVEKKKALAIILDEVANSDGHFHEKEMELILNIFTATDIYKEIL